eukprot:SAG31_NODE_7352_length_1712_cov_1.132052_1_plen_109_part_10
MVPCQMPQTVAHCINTIRRPPAKSQCALSRSAASSSACVVSAKTEAWCLQANQDDSKDLISSHAHSQTKTNCKQRLRIECDPHQFVGASVRCPKIALTADASALLSAGG